MGCGCKNKQNQQAEQPQQPQTQAQPTDDFVSFLTQKPEVAIEEEKVKPTLQKVQPAKDNRSAMRRFLQNLPSH